MHLILAAVGTIAALTITLLASTLVGGIIGYVVDVFFPYIIGSLNNIMELKLTGFEMGSMLGFVSGFFRSSR